MKQRNRKKIGIRAMRKLLSTRAMRKLWNAWPHGCHAHFKYLGFHGIGLVMGAGAIRNEDEGWMSGPSMEG